MSKEQKEDAVMFKCPNCGKEGDVTTVFWWDENDEADVCCESCNNVMRFVREPRKVVFDYKLIECTKESE